MTADLRERLLAIIRERAVLHGDFILTSGQRSSFYLDARRVTLSAAGSPLVGEIFLEMIEPHDVQIVAGMTVAADPIVTSIAVVAGQRGLGIDAVIVRKEAKQHGVGGRMAGPWRQGARVAVVDDTGTTGGSVLEAARAVEEAGGTVAGVWTLIDRNQGAREAVEAAGYSYGFAYSVSEIL